MSRVSSAWSGSATGGRTSRGTSTSSPTCAGSATSTTEPAGRSPRATRRRALTADFDELLADPELDAVVIATPVPTHYELAKRALEAGKHVLVEKPPAMNAAEAEELVAARRASATSCSCPATCCSTTPRVRKLKELMDAGELGDVLCVYSNRQNLGKIRADENALWSLGVHDLSVILLPARRGAVRDLGARQRVPHTRASRTSSSATCASPPGKSRTCTSPGSTRTRCGR